MSTADKRARESAYVRQAEEDIRRYIKERVKELSAQIGRKAGAPRLPYKLIHLPAFTGSSRVPLELLRAYLAHQDAVDGMTVPARHEYLIAIALRAIGAEGEAVDKQVWYAPLESYQKEPMHELLRQAGYFPSDADDTLTKLRKLVLAGRPESGNASESAFGEGIHRVYFIGNVAHYRGEARTIQRHEGRVRVKVNGKLISIWVWLKESVSRDDQARVLELIRKAEWDEAARKVVIEQAQEQAAQRIADEDVLADMFETVDTGIVRDCD
ncbi:hypothetical protein F6X40_01905 [Paraburkholderia sp. UCT31]|uniref:hypothetical protein n=1 Tax=Paraburkholderia sp. UCT31 TaxID=2615209 RepID=UPI001655A1C8|nr:hypothetical protein [Paraburkholderia sp. UCT31]MBC8735619.1 hypothetical protein [Paraburkholderia sp. UCT31]